MMKMKKKGYQIRCRNNDSRRIASRHVAMPVKRRHFSLKAAVFGPRLWYRVVYTKSSPPLSSTSILSRIPYLTGTPYGPVRPPPPPRLLGGGEGLAAAGAACPVAGAGAGAAGAGAGAGAGA